MRTLLTVFVVTVGLVGGIMIAQGQPPAGGGGKGKAHVNLKVLPDDATLVPTMQSFVAALGLGDKGSCNFCHEMDRSSDAKMEKVMARMMISMVKDINSKFPDGKAHVACYTCHRGDTMPKMAP